MLTTYSEYSLYIVSQPVRQKIARAEENVAAVETFDQNDPNRDVLKNRELSHPDN